MQRWQEENNEKELKDTFVESAGAKTTFGESRSIFTSLGSFIFKEFLSLDDDAFAPFEEET